MIFTDSVPLLAVFFKLFRGVLPEQFQYFGLWGLLCFALQGAFGALLIFHYVGKRAEAAVGSLLFVITPVHAFPDDGEHVPGRAVADSRLSVSGAVQDEDEGVRLPWPAGAQPGSWLQEFSFILSRSVR